MQIKSILYLEIVVLLVFCIFGERVSASHYPSVSIFNPVDIGAGNQNWMIDQKPDGEFAIANGRGLLIYDGAKFKLYEGSVPNSICVSGDRIYSGGYMDLGYWQENETGDYHYHSLVDKLALDLIVDEQIWSIFEWGDGVIFQSLDRLIFYNVLNNESTLIPVRNGVLKMFSAMDRIYFQDTDLNLYMLNDLVPELYFSSSELPSSEIVNLFSTDYGIMIFTGSDGFYQLDKSGFKKWHIDKGVLRDKVFFSALLLENGNYALGSITNGLYVINKNGEVEEHFDQISSLSNNTVLHIFEDSSNNLWLGLDSGINVAHLMSPFEEYKDKNGKIGTVYAAALKDNLLYLGTNQGLFVKEYGSREEFSLVLNTNGQVWSLFLHGNELFCGHNRGTFLVDGVKATKIADINGTWKIIPYQDRNDVLLQGNYNGLHLLKKENGEWNYLKQIDSLDHSFRTFCRVGDYLYYYHATTGLIRKNFYELEDPFSTSKTIYQSEIREQTSLAKLGEYLLFSNHNGLHYSNNKMDSLIKLDLGRSSNDLLKDGPGKLVKLNDHRVAFFQSGNIHFLGIDDKGDIELEDILFMDLDHFKTKTEYENITQIDDEEFLIGMTNGYLMMNLKKVKELPDEYFVEISNVEVQLPRDSIKRVSLSHEEGFNFQENNFTFGFSVHNRLKYLSVQYQYKLEGEQNSWSDWTTNPSASFYKLSPGPYAFKVRARVGSQLTVNEGNFSFWIRDPWYRSVYAVTIYFILIVVSLFLINYIYQRVYSKRQTLLIEEAEREMRYIKLKSEQELIKEKNERLRSEIESKNKELAVTAMSMVKKNEFLIEIRDHLKDIEPTKSFKPDLVIRSINREIENEESWEMLKNAFENVDKDFIKTLLEKHPVLTPNDLKLCTYLRLNMNSKEIATLMNISVRSMETKRYRLRKKMGLSHDTNLVEYILAI